MEASGIQPVLPHQHINDPTHALRSNQRITAEILNVAADHVILALDGFPVVARLTSSDQLAELANKKTAQFIVRDPGSEQLLLQIVSSESGQTTSAANESALVARLLTHFGIPLDENNLTLAQQLIQEGVPITPETLAELRAVLDSLGSWNQQQAGTAVRLHKTGIPLSESALRLALTEHPGVLTALENLQDALTSLQAGKLPKDLQTSVRNTLQFLDRLFSMDSSRSSLMTSAHYLTSTLGSTLENSLLQALKDPAKWNLDPLLQLVTLRSGLDQAGQTAAAEIIDQVFTELQFQGMSNLSNPGHTGLNGRWFTLDLPFYAAQNLDGHEQSRMKQARLRITYEHEGQQKPVVDPANTHLKLHFPLTGGQEIDVDLVLADGSIAARINASSELLQGHAEQELPGLEEGFKVLGYEIQGLECLVSETPPVENPTPEALPGSASGINVEA